MTSSSGGRPTHSQRGTAGRTRFRLAVGAAWVALVTVIVPAGSASAKASESASFSRTGTACPVHVVNGVIPSWARAGFSSPKPTMNYELGQHGRIVALLWAYPLLYPPPTTHNNKILWVSKVPAGGPPLIIAAQRVAGRKPVGRAVHLQVPGGPGPSIINLPAAGCWHLSLTWSGRSDTLDLDYLARPT